MLTAQTDNQQLSDERELAVEDSRRANVNMRAAQLELESVRLRGELAAEEERKQRLAAERSAAEVATLQQQVDSLQCHLDESKEERHHLNNRLSDLEDQNQVCSFGTKHGRLVEFCCLFEPKCKGKLETRTNLNELHIKLPILVN